MYSVFWVSRYVITDYYYYYLKKNQNAPRPSEHPPVIIVRYCFLWLLCGRERFAQYCFLWRSCADARCLNWAGSISFVRTFLRGYLWASPFFFFFFFFFVDVGNRTNVFFVQEHILAKFGALRARIFNSRDRSL